MDERESSKEGAWNIRVTECDSKRKPIGLPKSTFTYKEGNFLISNDFLITS